MVSKQEEDHEELGLMISRIGQNWEITVNWKELQRIGQIGTSGLVNLLLKKKTQEEEEEEEVLIGSARGQGVQLFDEKSASPDKILATPMREGGR